MLAQYQDITTVPTDPALAERATFFERNAVARPEIVEGLLRRGQIAAIGGPFGVGKSPLLHDLMICRINGIPWCGRRTEPGPVLLMDFESAGAAFRHSVTNICNRYRVAVPRVPEHLDVYLLNDEANSEPTSRLLDALALDVTRRLELITEALARMPNALVIIDPPEVLFRIDTGKKVAILELYRQLRVLISEFPDAAVIQSFNMRKRDRRSRSSPDLLTDPRDWLEDICGTLDIMNRSDVRLGMDFYGDDRVVNGIRRSEEMDPLILRQVGTPPGALSGFEICPPGHLSLERSFTAGQVAYWRSLPLEFRFEQIADHAVPRASLYRILQRARSLGLVQETDGIWRRTA